MSWPTARYKTAAHGGSWTPDDMNGVQDQYLNATGFPLDGATSVAAQETRTNASYGTLTTPDQVSGVVLADDGLIFVCYEAVWTKTTDGTAPPGDARAAIFLNENQVKVGGNVSGSGSPQTQAAAGGVGTGLYSSGTGLVSASGAVTPVDTGMIVGAAIGGNPINLSHELGGTVISYSNTATAFGGPMVIRAAAGTYDVSVRFKSTTGVAVKNRHLWVWTATP